MRAGLWECSVLFIPKDQPIHALWLPWQEMWSEIRWYITPLCIMSVTPAKEQLFVLSVQLWTKWMMAPSYISCEPWEWAQSSWKCFLVWVISLSYLSMSFPAFMFPTWARVGEGEGNSAETEQDWGISPRQFPPLHLGLSHTSPLSIGILSDCFINYVCTEIPKEIGSRNDFLCNKRPVSELFPTTNSPLISPKPQVHERDHWHGRLMSRVS